MGMNACSLSQKKTSKMRTECGGDGGRGSLRKPAVAWRDDELSNTLVLKRTNKTTWGGQIFTHRNTNKRGGNRGRGCHVSMLWGKAPGQGHSQNKWSP